ncbi:type VII secretion-associated serine protease mycosin [Corynebacterium pacaense]|uniref:type VII secretion-associated serine protease mycosin n=1 Tax=Corynebacterium pacaense TaxID=1816684 RepID=UPI0009BA7F78|nr:type VII secretion-associated serine protease mycosin [Corynebacterium pacaense]
MRRRLPVIGTCILLAVAHPVSAQTAGVPECPAPVAVDPRTARPHEQLRGSLPLAHAIATGAGVKVAVVDTGVAPHPRLPAPFPGGDLVGAHSAANTPGELIDCDGHGTIVAGIIAARAKNGNGWPYDGDGDEHIGIAPGSEIIAIKQTTSQVRTGPDTGIGTLGSLADSIHRAIDHGARVVNVSVVSCIPPERAGDIAGTAIDSALIRAEESGVVVVSAAGNLSNHCPAGSIVYPAHAPTVLAVAASSDSHTIAGYSLPAPAPGVSAPGRVPAGLSPRDAGFSQAMRTASGSSPFEGTSFAAPVVAGTAALLIERHPQLPSAEIRRRITGSVDPSIGAVDPYLALTHVPADELPEEHPVRPAPPATVDASGRDRALLLLGALGTLLILAALIGGWSMGHRIPPQRRAPVSRSTPA